MAKKKTSVSLSDVSQQLQELLAEKIGVSKNDVVEIAIRHLAEKEKIKIPPAKKTKN